MTPKPVAFRPFHSIAKWIQKQTDKTEVMNQALIEYRQRKVISDEILAKLEQLGMDIDEIKRKIDS